MSLQICRAAGCKAITLLNYCEAHAEELIDEDEDEAEQDVIALTKEEPVKQIGRCIEKWCRNDRTENSERCAMHQGPTVKPPVSRLPAKRPAAPIALADPIVVNPPAHTNGQVSFAALDRMIENAEADLAALKRVRVIAERESAA